MGIVGSVVLCVCLGLCVVVVAIVLLSRGCGRGWVGHHHQPSVLWMCVVCVGVDGWVIMFVVMAMFVVVVGVVVVVCVSFSGRIRVCGCVCSVCSVCSV